FISRAARYVLRKRVRTAVLFIVLTIITASMLSATAVSQAAQHEAGQIEKQAVGGFVLASNLQGSMLTPRGGGMVRPADVQRISKLSGVGSYMVRQNATADLVGAGVVKVPGGDDYDAEKEQQFGNTANVMGTNDSSKLNVFTSHTLGMVEGRHLKASDKHMSMVHEDLAKANGLKVGDALTLKANPYDADNESHSTATVKTTIVGIFKGDSDRKVASRAELTSNTVYTDLDTTSTLYQYKAGKEIYQDATFVLAKGADVEKTMEAAKKLPVDWNNYQITRNDQYTSSMLNAARSVRSMMRGALIGVTISAVIVLSLMLLLWMNDRRQEMGVLVSLGIGKPSLIAQYLTEMILIGL
ncbi:ABC transporter permease, partial [Bifidobacterium adolescentis]